MKIGLAVALVIGFGTPLAVSPSASAADPLLIVPGAEYVALDKLRSGPVIDRVYTRSIDIGRGFFPDSTPTVIDYPATVYGKGTVNSHVNAGATAVDAAIKAAIKNGAGSVTVAGQSQGSVVVNVEQARLQNDPDAPAANKVTFVVFGDPQRGFMNTVFKDGTKIPFLGLVAQQPAESRYNTIVFQAEYDLWGDFPDRPWNLLALANAGFGSTFVHARAGFTPSDIPPENITVTTNSLGATTTTYFVPTQNLPLTEPLRLLGLPSKLIDALDKNLRPAIDAGYSRHDAPGSKKPYLSQGVIKRPAPSPAASALTSVPRAQRATAKSPLTTAPRRAGTPPRG